MTLKPLYTIRDLCTMTGLSREQIERLIRRNGIDVVKAGRRVYVPVSELRVKLRHVWDSLELTEAQWRATGSGGDESPGV